MPFLDRHGTPELAPGIELQERNVHDAPSHKGESVAVVEDLGFSSSLETQEHGATKSTSTDVLAMQRMGKDQQLVREYRYLSIASFACIAMATWEIGLFTIGQSLQDGGSPGLLWGTLWNFICAGPLWLSQAEMASMAPIAGAQYHWVSEFAPEKWQRFLSYMTGWTSTLAWQSGNAVGVFLVGGLVQALISIFRESYGFPAWQCALMAAAAMILAYAGSVYCAKLLPFLQNALLAVHVLAFFGLIVPIWIYAESATHQQVWFDFVNAGGWSTVPLAVLVGQLTPISQQVGIDTVAHMSEEVRDASHSVPRAMLTVYGLNFVLMFVAFLTICYHLPNPGAALNDPTGYETIYVMKQSMSKSWVAVLLVIIILLNFASNIMYLTATSRDLFAFARDKGVPLWTWLSKVHRTRKIPQNAAMASSVFAILLSLIYIGSPTAFWAINSLLTVALLSCYDMSTGCILYRRIYYPETLPQATFSLGRWGVFCNVWAIVWCTWSCFWCFWPAGQPVTAPGFNWASVIYAGVLIVALAYFVLKARSQYVGPVEDVVGRKVHRT